MFTVCYSPKGGQGCSTVTAMLALVHGPATIIDLCGDMPWLLGMPTADRAGITDVLATDTALTDTELGHCAIQARDGLELIPVGRWPLDRAPSIRWAVPSTTWAELARVLDASPIRYVVDAGVGSPLTKHATNRLLVIRHCFLALQHALHVERPTGIITIREPSTVLQLTDIERPLGAPVLGTVDYLPEVATAVNSGLLINKVPRAAERALRTAFPMT